MAITKQQVKMLTKSTKKHIREEKGRIRREFLDEEQRREEISKLYKKFIPENPKTTKDKPEPKKAKKTSKTTKKTKKKTAPKKTKKETKATKTKTK